MSLECEHVWAGVGHSWQCRECGIAGVDCPSCEGTGWASDEGSTEDCPRCKGAGALPAKTEEA